ncbi:hypothetical protein AB0O28_37120 [Microbispora sp. NPDC088329]|uniref:GerMN domain-containing protein n=1 Tax=Microbispora sp. NPDC088329 TaxID=3154869 RepID=UPI003429A818
MTRRSEIRMPVPRMPASRMLASCVLASCVLAGCGVPDTGPAPAGAPAVGARTADAAHWMRVYFIAPNGAWPVARAVPAGAGPQTALDTLLAGPTPGERERGLVTALPPGKHRVRAEATGPGTVDLHLPWLVSELDHVAVDQLVCTAAAAPGIPGGKPPPEVRVRIHEPGLAGGPWKVKCDETGAAVPAAAPTAR